MPFFIWFLNIRLFVKNVYFFYVDVIMEVVDFTVWISQQCTFKCNSVLWSFFSLTDTNQIPYFLISI